MDWRRGETDTRIHLNASILQGALACLRCSPVMACSLAAALLLLLSSVIAYLILLRRIRQLEGRALRDGLSACTRHRGVPGGDRGILRSATEGAGRRGLPSAVLLAGLDRFSSMMRAHGPCAGDDLLAALESKLCAATPSGGWVRVGGSLFALALAVIEGPEQAEAAALAVMRSLEPSTPLPEPGLPGTASLGVALLPRDAADLDGGLRAAHAALERARMEGGNRLRIFDPGRDGTRLIRNALAGELPDAIREGGILPYYQPIVDLRSGTLVGLEVLARWCHPTHGLLAPDAFMPAADEARLCGRITDALMRRVVLDARVWPSRLFFAFNVSPKQLGDSVGTGSVGDLLHWPKWTLDPARLEIEVTECGAIEDVDAARRGFAAWRERGTRVVLDEFGTGASNLSGLRDIQFDKIKVDKRFASGASADPRADACLRAVIDLGARLGVDTVAGGLENAAAANHVAAMGCRYGQGFFYSPPVPAGEVPALVRRMASPIPLRLTA